MSIKNMTINFLEHLNHFLQVLIASFAIATTSLELLEIFSASFIASGTTWSTGKTLPTSPVSYQPKTTSQE